MIAVIGSVARMVRGLQIISHWKRMRRLELFIPEMKNKREQGKESKIAISKKLKKTSWTFFLSKKANLLYVAKSKNQI